jgi:hypothetical protein
MLSHRPLAARDNYQTPRLSTDRLSGNCQTVFGSEARHRPATAGVRSVRGYAAGHCRHRHGNRSSTEQTANGRRRRWRNENVDSLSDSSSDGSTDFRTTVRRLVCSPSTNPWTFPMSVVCRIGTSHKKHDWTESRAGPTDATSRIELGGQHDRGPSRTISLRQ